MRSARTSEQRSGVLCGVPYGAAKLFLRTERSRRVPRARWSVPVRVIMNQLGHTRSANHRDHLLQTPDAFVRAPLPGMHQVTAIVHVAPPAGAAFTQYTAEFEAGGVL